MSNDATNPSAEQLPPKRSWLSRSAPLAVSLLLLIYGVALNVGIPGASSSGSAPIVGLGVIVIGLGIFLSAIFEFRKTLTAPDILAVLVAILAYIAAAEFLYVAVTGCIGFGPHDIVCPLWQ